MEKIIITMLLGMFFINLHAQNVLPYKSLSDFQNDTTAFINYNFIDRAEQYKGKTLELIVRDLQIPIEKATIDGFYRIIDGLFLCLYEDREVNRLRENKINKPHTILVKWKESIPDNKVIMTTSEMINYYKDFQIDKIEVIYPLGSEHQISTRKPAKKYNGEIIEPWHSSKAKPDPD
ncbi:MAG: hypothetical protein FWD60_00830 [Candidatus Azobacteroides sp.]|nr:hypothetical protein [Candidatus Azobacteroides sp.]